MFTRILVPLDGSSRAEQALPLAAHIARASHCTIVLVRVVDIAGTVGVASVQAAALLNEMRESQEREAKTYLQQIRTSQMLKQGETVIEMHTGDAASTLLDVIAKQSIDFVVMSSHGSTGYKRWLLGSVAQKVARLSPAPVLIQRGAELFPFDAAAKEVKVCVALDGTALAEEAILPALHLVATCAQSHAREVHLFRVVKELDEEEVKAFQRMHQVNIQQFLDDEAKKYLQELSERLRTGEGVQLGVRITWSVSRGRDIAETIVHEVEGEASTLSTSRPYALLAMATHGRSGVAPWVIGSVANRVLNSTRLPILVVHPHRQNQEG